MPSRYNTQRILKNLRTGFLSGTGAQAFSFVQPSAKKAGLGGRSALCPIFCSRLVQP